MNLLMNHPSFWGAIRPEETPPKSPTNYNTTTRNLRSGTERMILEEADAKSQNWLLQYLNRTSANFSYNNRNLYKDLNEQSQEVLSQNTKGSLQILLKEMQEIYSYLHTKYHTMESLEYKA